MTALENNRSIRVAVVEDNAAFRRGLHAIFGLTPGLECVGMFATGEEALRDLPKAAPDVVLMDIRMPVLNGLAATRRILSAPVAPGARPVRYLLRRFGRQRLPDRQQ